MSLEYPTGTVTFLFSDVEGSTELAHSIGEQAPQAIELHFALFRDAVRRRRGYEMVAADVVMSAAFGSALDAATCAADLQRKFASQEFPGDILVRLRIGLHTGEASIEGGVFGGPDVKRVERISRSAHGGQVVMSATTAALIERSLPPNTRLRDQGTHELQDLAYPEHILQLVIEGLQEDFPPLRTLSALRSNLPNRSDVFIGRAEEKERLVAAIEGHRLVTLTGPAGVGKSRLAAEAAGGVVDSFTDGVWLVDISRVGDAGLIASALAKQLNVSESGPQSLEDLIFSRLARAETLLVLDGCEHLLQGVCEFVGRLLSSAAHAKVLATSREPLAVAMEEVVRLRQLASPPHTVTTIADLLEYDSVALFVNRAEHAQPGFTLEGETPGIVGDIVRRLDGLPLAIELAAAQLSDRTLAEVGARLDHQLTADRGGSKTLGPEHRTLEATLDSSYDSLKPDEALLFARLAVFSGGFTQEAAVAVCAGDGIDHAAANSLLRRLVDTSLVVASLAEPGRYRFLEPIAQYARLRLAQKEGLDSIRRHHADYFLHLAEQADPKLRGPDQVEWANTLDRERYNFRSALRWARVHDTETSLRLVGALRWFWVIQRDIAEGAGWLRSALADRGNAPPEVVALALNGVGLLAFRALDLATAERAVNESLAYYKRLGDEAGMAQQLYHLGILRWFEDDSVGADELLSQARELSRSAGDSWYLAWALAISGTIARSDADLGRARGLMEESHGLFQRSGGKLDCGWSHLRLGALARDEGDYQEASRAFSQGRILLASAGDEIGIAHADAGLGALAWLDGRQGQAVTLFANALDAFGTGDEAANNLFELKEMIQGNPSVSELQQVAQWNAERAEFADDLGAKAAMAEYLYHLGKTAFRLNNLEKARTVLLESLSLCGDARDYRGAAVALIGLGSVVATQNDHEVSVILYAAAANVADFDELEPWPPVSEPDYERLAAEARTALGERAEEVWNRGLTIGQADLVAMVRRSGGL